MAEQLTEPTATRSPWERRAGWLTFLAVLVLAPLAAVLVLWAFPAAFDIEWRCTGTQGVTRTSGDLYIAFFAVVGTFGWIAILLASVFARIAERPRLAATLALGWFVVLVGAALVMAAAVGPELCQA